ncbi:MAG: beta-1 [Lasallia pustulata]|uniref:Beta-1 n=1 Tax=Lasallia pustulata TaxID=136370 RepID=A0A5M8PS68_9LECA|nr:MAG: beta-1 [Lasallia pustulata]
MLMRPFALLAAAAPFAFADVKFTTPAPAAQLTAGSSLSLGWVDSGTAPSISDLASYQIFLCAGGNDANSYAQLAQLAQGTFAASNGKASVSVQASLGASTTNAYFLKMVSVATAGGSVTNYSPRFSVAGMTGTFSANVVAGIGTISGTAGPATENNVAQNQAAAQDDKYAVPYTLQTGLTKYAPMQPQPPTKITAQSASPMWPTSSVSIATTWLPRPSQVTTSTQTQTFSMSSMENTAAPAPQPSDDMQKFLARWRD